MNSIQALVDDNIEHLMQALRLLSRLDDETYTATDSPVNESEVVPSTLQHRLRMSGSAS